MNFENAPRKAFRAEFFCETEEKFYAGSCGILTKSILGEDIHYYKFGRGKSNLLFVGAHHSMEHITASVLYEIIAKISENLRRDKSFCGVNLKFWLQKFTFWFIPCLNPDGIDLFFGDSKNNVLYERQVKMNGGEDFFAWQANARGVDLNHNYDFGFSEYKLIEKEKKITPGKTAYSGEYPESEPESRALANLVRVIRPSLIVSLHSQGKEIFYRPRESARVRRIAERCAEILDYRVSLPQGGADFGGLSDYAGENLGIPSLTVEVGLGKNPLPDGARRAIAEGVMKLVYLLPAQL